MFESGDAQGGIALKDDSTSNNVFLLATGDDFGIQTGGVANRLTVKSDGKVGIGTTSPDGQLHVHTATAGTMTAHVSADDLVVENSDHGGISILTPNNRTGAIYFGDVEDNNIGALHYNHSLNKLVLTVAAADRFSLSANTAEFASTIAKISGSATSTGSFGTVEAKTFRGDGSALTGITATAGAAGNQYNVQFNSDGSSTAGSDNFVFNSSNNRVGIGTSSPTRALTISGSDFSSTSINLNRSDSGTHNDSAIIFEAESTAATGVALGGFWFKNAVDDTTNAILRVRTDNTAGTNGRFEFVTGTGLNNNSTPVMVVKGDGNVGIGTQVLQIN